MSTKIKYIIILFIFSGISFIHAQSSTFSFKKFDYSTVNKYYIKYGNSVETSYEFTDHENYNSITFMNDTTIRFSKDLKIYEDVNIDNIGKLSFVEGHNLGKGLAIGCLIGLLGGTGIGYIMDPPTGGWLSGIGAVIGALTGFIAGGITGAIIGGSSDGYEDYDLSKLRRDKKNAIILKLGIKYGLK